MTVLLAVLKLYLRHFVRRRLEQYETPEQMRRALGKSAQLLPEPPSDARFEPETIALGDRDLAMVWCRWGDAPTARVVLYFHGGAYIAGSPATHRSISWTLARAAEARIASVDYRLAPEHAFPAAVEDALVAYDHLVGSGIAPGSIVLAGDSAGGGLAFALAGEIDRTGRPRPAGILGFSPFTDLTLSGESLRINAQREILLPVWRVREAVEQYLQGADPRDPRASPIFADYAGPWRALIQVGDTEALLADSVRMTARLRAAGGDAQLDIWEGTPHVWQFFAPHIHEARQAIQAAGAFIRDVAAP